MSAHLRQQIGRIKAPTDLYELDRQIVAKGGLYEFVRLAWHLVEPGVEFSDNWHIPLICAHLEAVSRGEITRLLINIPPGCMKSLLVCVFWPAWDWAVKNPGRRFMGASYDALLTRRDAQRTRELVTSKWFRKRWGDLADKDKLAKLEQRPVWVLEASPDRANTATLYWTQRSGMRFATSFGGRATGWHCNFQIVDDPTNPTEIQRGGDQARAALEQTWATWKGTFASRKADPKSFSRVIVMQRLHELDLAGQEIEASKAADALPYVKVVLPMEFEPENACDTPWGKDPRTEKGELLWPDRYDAKSVAQTKKDLGPLQAAAQLQQRPNPESGSVFQRAWLSLRWKVLPAGGEYIQSWDATFADTAGSDYVAGHVWYRVGARYYLVDRVHGRMDFPTFLQAIRDLTVKWPHARTKLVENKANGAAAEQTLRNEIPGILLVDPLGGKWSRASAASAYYEAGNVFLPETPWVGDFVSSHVGFPTAAHDDDVDAGGQAILYWEGKAGNTLARALQKVKAQRLKGSTNTTKSGRVPVR